MCELSSLNVLNDTYVVPPGTFFYLFLVHFFQLDYFLILLPLLESRVLIYSVTC